MHAPEFWDKNDLLARAARAALSPAGWIYGASIAYRRDHAQGYRSAAKVLCVGNLTAGGSGKTPVAIAVAKALLARGEHVAFLTRGYGGRMKGPVLVDASTHTSTDVGDEPLLLASAAPTIVACDRAEGAKLAEANGAGFIVMDDGHQNFSLKKDLSIVVVDAGSGFGNGHLLPAGPLREPVAQGLARADAVVLAGPGESSLGGFRGPVLRVRIEPGPVPAVRRVVAFAGIGRPSKFYSTLRTLGVDLVACHSFSDHHVYSNREIAALKEEARSAGAALMTTEKDYVRLSTSLRDGIATLPIRAEFERPEMLSALMDTPALRPPA